MATQFQKGQQVKHRGVIPSGPVSAFRMDENGDIFCLIYWTDADGVEQSRWFKESELIAVE